jgi:hypothetical protein
MYLTLHLMYLPYAGSTEGVHVVTLSLCCYSSLSSLAFYVECIQMYRGFDL